MQSRLIPISLTYDNETLQDGVGAQVLREVDIKAISLQFKLGYLHSGIKQIIVTQLDIAQTTEQIARYVEYVNSVFNLPSDGVTSFDEIYSIYDLSRRKLAKYYLRSLFLRRSILLKIVVPYDITNKMPWILSKAKNFLPEIRKSNIKVVDDKFKIVIHFRQGTNPAHIDPGKIEPRFIPMEYFEKLVFRAIEQNPGRSFDICLLTDAPPEEMMYKPPASQIKAWEDAGYEIIDGMVKVQPLAIEESQLRSLPQLRIIHGGDVMQALEEMQSADLLFMSRSTLSILGGLLNKSGKAIFPARLNIIPLKEWISGEDYLGNI